MIFLNEISRVIVSTDKLERLKTELGKLILEKIGKSLQINRIEELATIFPLNEKIPGKDRIMVIGINGHFDESEEKMNETQEADSSYSYFRSFEEYILNGIENIEIKFFDLVPVRTGRKIYLGYGFFKDELASKIQTYLESAIELYDPDLILANSVDVSEFMIKNLCHGKEDGRDTVAYCHINKRKIPVVLSGQISGVRRIDNYNRIRLLREINEELNKSRNTI